MTLRRFVWGLGVIALVGLSTLGVRAFQGQGEGPWLEVQQRDMILGVPFEGELEAVDSVLLGPPQIPRMWNLKVSFLAPEGKEIAAGQPVLRFDGSELQRRLQQQMSERDSAEKKLEKREQDLEVEQRRLELQLEEARARWRQANFAVEVPAEVVSRREIEEAKIDQRLAQLEIDHLSHRLDGMAGRRQNDLANLRQRRDRAAAKVDELRRNLEFLTVKAPRDGTVILTTDWRDQKVKVGDQVWRARKVLEIPDLTHMRVEAEVAEADVGRLEVGQAASLFLDAYPDHEYLGRLASIRRAVQAKSTRSAEKIVKVKIDLDATDTQRMRPGMRLRGRLVVERLQAVTTVPNDAVFTDANGVWVMQRTVFGKERRRPRLGSRNDRYFQVLEGLQPGDRVLGRSAADTGEGSE